MSPLENVMKSLVLLAALVMSLGPAAASAKKGSSMNPESQAASQAKIAPQLLDVPGGATVNVIVQFNKKPTRGVLDKLVAKGCELEEELTLIKAVVFSLPASLLADVAAEPSVVRISPNGPVSGLMFHANGTLGVDLVASRLSRTSMAAPMVSGAVALMLEKSPGLTPDQVKARLMKTASKTFPMLTTANDPVTGAPFTSYYDIFTVGAGYLDIHAALSENGQAGGLALSPRAIFDSQTGEVSLVFDNGVIWGTGVVRGTGVVWGTQVFANGVIWGTGVVWGTGSPEGTGVIWGTGDTVEAMSVLVVGEE